MAWPDDYDAPDAMQPGESVGAYDTRHGYVTPEAIRHQARRVQAKQFFDKAKIPTVETNQAVQPVRDEAGKPLNFFDKAHDIAWDSQGAPRKIVRRPDGVTLADPYADAPLKVDKQGNRYRAPDGLPWSYDGVDEPTVQRIQDKRDSTAATVIGQQASLAKTGAKELAKDLKARQTELEGIVPSLATAPDPDTARKAIDEHFNEQYAAKEANVRQGWFNTGELTETSAAIRAQIDQRKADVHGQFDQMAQRGKEYDALQQQATAIQTQARTAKEGVLARKIEKLRAEGAVIPELPEAPVAGVAGVTGPALATSTPAVAAAPQPDRSYISAFMQGIDQPLEAAGTTAEVLGAPSIGGALKGLTDSPANYESASEKFMNEGGDGFGWSFLPRALVEQAGQLGGSILSRVLGGVAGGAIGGSLGAPAAGAGAAPGAVAGAAIGAFAGPFLFSAVQIAGPTAKERAQRNGRTEPNGEDIAAALLTAAASGSLDAIGAKYLPGGSKATGTVVQKLVSAIIGEGVTEGTQSLVEQTGQSAGSNTGLDLSLKQAAGEGILGAGAGGVAAGVGAAIPGSAPAVPPPLPEPTQPPSEPAPDETQTPPESEPRSAASPQSPLSSDSQQASQSPETVAAEPSAAPLDPSTPQTATSQGASLEIGSSPEAATPQPEPQESNWMDEALAERRAKGWNDAWPFVPADLQNAGFVEAIKNDPSIPAEEKVRILSFAPKVAQPTLAGEPVSASGGNVAPAADGAQGVVGEQGQQPISNAGTPPEADTPDTTVTPDVTPAAVPPTTTAQPAALPAPVSSVTAPVVEAPAKPGSVAVAKGQQAEATPAEGARAGGVKVGDVVDTPKGRGTVTTVDEKRGSLVAKPEKGKRFGVKLSEARVVQSAASPVSSTPSAPAAGEAKSVADEPGAEGSTSATGQATPAAQLPDASKPYGTDTAAAKVTGPQILQAEKTLETVLPKAVIAKIRKLTKVKLIRARTGPAMETTADGVTVNTMKLAANLNLIEGDDAKMAYVVNALDEELKHVATLKALTAQELEAIGASLTTEERETTERLYGSKMSDFVAGAEAIRLFMQGAEGNPTEAYNLFTAKAKRDKGFRDAISKVLAYIRDLASRITDGALSSKLTDGIAKTQAVLDSLETTSLPSEQSGLGAGAATVTEQSGQAKIAPTENPDLKSQNATSKNEPKPAPDDKPSEFTVREYAYGMKARPFSIGAQPKGQTRVDEDDKRARWGVVYYDKPLSDDDVRSFELVPLGEEATAKQLVQEGDEVTWTAGDGRTATSTVDKILPDGRAIVDWFGTKYVPVSELTIKRKSTSRENRERKAKAVDTPAQASKEIATEIKKAKTGDNPRPAKDIKAELISKLKTAQGKAADMAPLLEGKTVEAWSAGKKKYKGPRPLLDVYLGKYETDVPMEGLKDRNGQMSRPGLADMVARTLEEKGVKKVTFEIPGDGTFSIWNTKETIGELLSRVEKMPVKLAPYGPPSTGSGVGQTDAQRLAEQAENQLGGRSAAMDWLKENAKNATPSEKKIHEAAIELLKSGKPLRASEPPKDSTPPQTQPKPAPSPQPDAKAREQRKRRFDILYERLRASEPEMPILRASNAILTGPVSISLRASEPITAHHGTPHRVDKFSTSKIGMGEGAQVFGHGLYFAENTEVRDEYQRAFELDYETGRRARFTIAGSAVTPSTLANFTDRLSPDAYQAAVDVMIAERHGEPVRSESDIERVAGKRAAALLAEGFAVNRARGYTVTLDVEPDELLDWDKPFSQQSKKVQAEIAQAWADLSPLQDVQLGKPKRNEFAIEDAMQWTATAALNDPDIEVMGTFYAESPEALEAKMKAWKEAALRPDATATGQDIYQQLVRWVSRGELREADEASRELMARNIPGIRYLDQGSRTPGVSKYRVQWDKTDTIAEVIEKATGKSMGTFDTFKEADKWVADHADALTYNYVIFDDSKIRITHENGQPVSVQEALRASEPSADYEAAAEEVAGQRIRGEETPAGQMPDSDAVSRLRERAAELTAKTGFPDVSIADLMEGAGFDSMDDAKGALVAMADAGELTFGGGDWSLSSPREKAWSIVHHGNETAAYVRFNEKDALRASQPEAEDETIPPNGRGPDGQFFGTGKPDEHRFPKQVVDDKSMVEELRDAVHKTYDITPNKFTAVNAQAEVDKRSSGEVISIIKDESNGLPAHVRSTMGQIVIKRLNDLHKRLKADGDPAAEYVLNTAVDLADWQTDFGWKLGLGVQSFAMWARLSPEGKLAQFRKLIRGARQKHKAKTGKEVGEIQDKLNDINKGAANGAASSDGVKAAVRRASKGGSIWGRYKTKAVEGLTDKLTGREQAGDAQPALSRFTATLVRELKSRMPSFGKADGETLTPEEIIREGVTNMEKYQEVWKAAQDEVRRAFKDNDLMLQHLDDFLGQALNQPFSNATLAKAVRQQITDDELKLRALVKEHYTKSDAAGAALGQKIAEQLGVSPEQAQVVAGAVEREFARLTTKAKVDALRGMIRTNPTALRLVKTNTQKIIEASNVGALTDETFYDATSEQLGLPKYDKDVAAKIMDLAEKVELAPEGMPKDKAILDLNSYIARQKGFDASNLPVGIYYGNLLSGYNTHIVNFLDTLLNVTSEIGGLAINNPRAALKAWGGLMRGFDQGRHDFVQALTKGRMVTDGKWLEVPRLMELAEFGKKGGVPITSGRGASALRAFAESPAGKPLNLWKYVTRLMAASDGLMFRGAKEARAAVLAHRMATAEGLAGDALNTRMREILALDRMSDFEAQAKREGFTGRDATVRALELREMARPGDINQDAADFAGEATYNHDPHGTLGSFATAIGRLSDKHPALKLFVPFTRIVANVTSRSLNYTPYGFKRAIFGWGFGEKAEGLDPEQRRLMLTRATMGTVGMTMLGAAQAAGLLVIHGGGPSDEERKKQLRDAGWKPYSIQIGDQYITYTYSPIGLGLSIIGNMSDGPRYKELSNKDAGTRAAYAVMRVPATVFNQSFLSGLSRLFDALSDQPGKSVSGVKQFLSSTTGSVLPLGLPANFTRDVQRLFDPKIYKADNIAEDMIRNTPFAAMALKPALNAFGEPINYSRQRFLGVLTSDPQWRFVIEKGLRVPVPDKSTEMPDGKGGRRQITPDEYYSLLSRSGPLVRQWVANNKTRLEALPTQDAQDELVKGATGIRKNVLAAMRGPSGLPTKKVASSASSQRPRMVATGKSASWWNP